MFKHSWSGPSSDITFPAFSSVCEAPGLSLCRWKPQRFLVDLFRSRKSLESVASLRSCLRRRRPRHEKPSSGEMRNASICGSAVESRPSFCGKNGRRFVGLRFLKFGMRTTRCSGEMIVDA